MSEVRTEYELIRSARKTLAVQITSTGRVVVRAPLRLSVERIESFIEAKYDWITAQVKMSEVRNSILPELRDGESISFLSRSYNICLCDERRNAFVCDDKLYLPRGNPKKALKSYVSKEFLPYASEKTKAKANEFGFNYKEVKIVSTRRRWGSCSAGNVIRYNVALAFLPEKAFDGVVAHELCHTLVKNHGKRFYALLYKVMPDYDFATSIRKRYGAFCSFFSEDIK